MKKQLFVLISCLLWAINGCTTSDKQVGTTSEINDTGNPSVNTVSAVPVSVSDSEIRVIDLEKAIADCSEFFISRLPDRRSIAILDIETPTQACSKFIIEELWKHFQKSGNYRMADQQNIRRIQEQLIFQANGDVSEESAASIGKLTGAQNIIYGRLVKFGDIYRLNLFLTEVESGESVVETKNINPADPYLKNLLEPGDLDSRIEVAITDLASNLNQKLIVGIDRIQYANTGSVTELARYLENQIRYSAGRLYTRYAVADSSSDIMATVKGSYTSDGRNGAEVTLNLTDRGGMQLGVCRFNVTEREMKDRNLTLVPANYGSIESYEIVQRKLKEFDTSINSFTFEAKPSRSDALYHDGEYITFTLHSNRDCYFLVQFLFVDGTVVDMYPTNTREYNFIRAGETRVLPDRGRIRLTKPYGEEYVLISAFSEQIAITNETVILADANFGTRGAEKEDETVTGLLYTQEAKGIVPISRTKFSYTIIP